MKLREVPEGEWCAATYKSTPHVQVVRHIDGKVERAKFKGEYSSFTASDWSVVESISHELALRTRIADLEAALAKANRPVPAVGQVWRNNSGVEYVIQRDKYQSGAHVFAYADNYGSHTAMPLSNFIADDNTYVGIWTGEFPVKEVAK